MARALSLCTLCLRYARAGIDPLRVAGHRTILADLKAAEEALNPPAVVRRRQRQAKRQRQPQAADEVEAPSANDIAWMAAYERVEAIKAMRAQRQLPTLEAWDQRPPPLPHRSKATRCRTRDRRALQPSPLAASQSEAGSLPVLRPSVSALATSSSRPIGTPLAFQARGLKLSKSSAVLLDGMLYPAHGTGVRTSHGGDEIMLDTRREQREAVDEAESLLLPKLELLTLGGKSGRLQLDRRGYVAGFG